MVETLASPQPVLTIATIILSDAGLVRRALSLFREELFVESNAIIIAIYYSVAAVD